MLHAHIIFPIFYTGHSIPLGFIVDSISGENISNFFNDLVSEIIFIILVIKHIQSFVLL